MNTFNAKGNPWNVKTAEVLGKDKNASMDILKPTSPSFLPSYNNWMPYSDIDGMKVKTVSSDIKKPIVYGKQCPQCFEVNEKDANWCLECGKAVLSVEVRRFDTIQMESHQENANTSRSAPIPNNRFQFLGVEQHKVSQSSLRHSDCQNKVTSSSKAVVNNQSVSFDFHNPQFDEEISLQGFQNEDSSAVYRKVTSQEAKHTNFYAFDDALYPNYAIYNPSLGYVFPSSNVVSNGCFYNQQVHYEMPLTRINNQEKDGFKRYAKLKKKKYKNNCSSIIQGSNHNEYISSAECQENVKEKLSMPTYVDLPDEILLKVFSHISLADIARCCQVCKQFNRIANDECLWKEITIKRNHNLTDIVLSKIARKTPRVIKITQCNGKRITEDGLRHLFRACAESLEFLDISGCSGGVLNGESVLLHVSSRCRNIRSLDISWSTISNIGVQSICESTNGLVQFSLNGCQRITDDSVIAIAERHAESLKILELFGCFNLTPNSINKVARLCPNIEKLNLGQCHKMTNDVLLNIATNLSCLQSLDVRGCKQIRDNSLKQVITHCPKLTSLVIANCPGVTDSTLYTVSAYLPDLRTLDACGCCKISDRGIHAMAKKCHRLSVLDLSSTKVTNKSVMSLAYNCNEALLSLKLSFCHSITDTCLFTVAQRCKRLRTLHLYGCKPLRHLWRLTELNPQLKIEKESGR